VDLIAGSLLAAAICRARYLAILELRLASLRRPALEAAVERLSDATAGVRCSQWSARRRRRSTRSLNGEPQPRTTTDKADFALSNR
jgi:hypothetical protein